MENITGIYMIKNLTNGKCYIGSAVKIVYRINKHIAMLNKNEHHSIKLQRAWNKYGAESFGFYTIQNCDKKDCIKNEQYWIDFFNSFTNGYNGRPKADNNLGSKWGTLTIKKMSEKVFTNEHKNNISKAKKGVKSFRTNPVFERKIIQLDLNNNFIKEFSSIKIASEQLKINNISPVCQGKRKTAGGFKFKYK